MSKSVVHDLRNYLVGATVSPDSVITTPFNQHQIFVGTIKGFSEISPSANGLQVLIQEAGGVANPKWVRDSWTVSIQAIGENRTKYMQCEELLRDVIHTLIGSPTRYIGDRAYVQFSSNQLPQFVGYLDNSRPLFSSTIGFVVEGLKDEYNRKALC